MRATTGTLLMLLVSGALATGCGSGAGEGGVWLTGAHVFVDGVHAASHDCRGAICRHNENVDLITWQGAIWLVHRTAESQVLGQNSALHVYRSADDGASFVETAILPAPAPGTAIGGAKGRDLRDPHFFVVGGELCIKALARLPVTSARDADVDTATLVTRTSNGKDFSPLVEVAPHGWSFWRIQRSADGRYHSAAYADGDTRVALFSSSDGLNWTQGADVYAVAADTPLETELVPLPSGTLLALVRMDGTDQELLGTTGRLRTKVCRAAPPSYASFDCAHELTGARLDGPLAWLWHGRLLSVARKHFMDGRKRTALFELTGNFDSGPLGIHEWGELPSAGDTAYAGAASLDGERFTLGWYSGDLETDDKWIFGMLAPTDIWTARFEPGQLPTTVP